MSIKGKKKKEKYASQTTSSIMRMKLMEKLGADRRLGNKSNSDGNSSTLPVETSSKPLEQQTWKVHPWDSSA
jgi:hypothetical protein